MTGERLSGVLGFKTRCVLGEARQPLSPLPMPSHFWSWQGQALTIWGGQSDVLLLMSAVWFWIALRRGDLQQRTRLYHPMWAAYQRGASLSHPALALPTGAESRGHPEGDAPGGDQHDGRGGCGATHEAGNGQSMRPRPCFYN